MRAGPVLIALTLCLSSALAIDAIAHLTGNDISGTVTFTPRDDAQDGVNATISITGLAANHVYSMHIHNYGDISKSDGTATGGHFNPFGVAHGCAPDTRHAGDLGNVTSDANGEANLFILNELASLDSSSTAYIIGRGLILHAERDDCSASNGNAGARIAQGVIGYKQNSADAITTGNNGIADPYAVANLVEINSSGVSGTVTFREANNVVSVHFEVTGLDANSKHGIHIHQYGDLSNPTDGTSTGGHYNPDGVSHGCPGVNATHHVGDMGNYLADDNGKIVATFNFGSGVTNLRHAAKSILGRAVIVHSGSDDCFTPNTGGAGSRLAFGVIGTTNVDYNPAPTDAPTDAPTETPTPTAAAGSVVPSLLALFASLAFVARMM